MSERDMHEMREHWENQRRHIIGVWVALATLLFLSVGTILSVGRWSGELDERVGQTQVQVQSLSERKQRTHNDYDARIRVLESSRATDASEIVALRRDLTEFRTDIRELSNLLRRLETRYEATP